VSIEKLRNKFNIKLTYTLFPLHPYTPEEGLTMEELFKGREFEIQAAKERLQKLMDAEGLEYGNRSRTYNSRLAQEMAKWAESQGVDSKIHNALYRAYFVDGINLAKVDNLVPIAESMGLDGEEARKVLLERQFKDIVDQDWEHCYQMGISAVPTYICNDQRLVGAQSYESFEQILTAAGAALS
jgi:predicted DsbA family dithiol-disulfide isomerase